MTQVAEKAVRTIIGTVISDARHMTRTVEVVWAKLNTI